MVSRVIPNSQPQQLRPTFINPEAGNPITGHTQQLGELLDITSLIKQSSCTNASDFCLWLEERGLHTQVPYSAISMAFWNLSRQNNFEDSSTSNLTNQVISSSSLSVPVPTPTDQRLRENVREQFEGLTDAQRDAVNSHVYALAQSQTRSQTGAETEDFSAPSWGEMHAFDTIRPVYEPRMMAPALRLRENVREQFEGLTDAHRDAVYGHVYALAQSQTLSQTGEETEDFSAPPWGEMHAFDTIPRTGYEPRMMVLLPPVNDTQGG